MELNDLIIGTTPKVTDTYLDRCIAEDLQKIHDEDELNHESSGKLSASQLSKPLQWQVLKVIGVPRRPIDDYGLRTMKRGKDVEDVIVGKHLRGVVETQKAVTYRDTVGLVDAVVDMADWDCKCGVIPHEVKSVKNSKYARIIKQGEPDISYKLQAALYALGMGVDKYAIDIVAADDYRVTTWLYETKDIKELVDQRINEFQKAIADKVVPTFEAREKWQEKSEWNDYADWAGLTLAGIEDKLQREFKEQYKVLKGTK